MIRSVIPLAVLAVLAACGGNPFVTTDDGGGTTTPTTIPTAIAGNVSSFAYDATNQTLTARIFALDSTPVDVVYARDAARDTAGYEAYSVQEDSLDRFFVALVGQSTDGTVRSGVIGDGGQFNRVLQGVYYERDGDFDAPDIGTGPAAGQVSYAGNYAGLTNIGSSIPTPGVDPSLWPSEPVRISGEIFLNANFSDMAVNGAIYDRQLLLATPADLPDLALIITDIGADGSFSGDVEYVGDINNTIGSYAGIFGGTDAASVGGGINLEEFDNDLLAMDNELESGFFVLTQCGQPGAAPVCSNVAP